ncbi:hypothetical protein ACVNP0_10110 [Staphylococcus aureus]
MTERKCACNKLFNSSRQQREIGFPISTDNASWGVGPDEGNLICQTLGQYQVGVWAPTQRISKRNSTGNASWVEQRNKFLRKYHFCPLHGALA